MFKSKFKEIPFFEQSKVKAGIDVNFSADGCSCSCSCYGTAGKADDKSSSNDDVLKEV